MIIDIIYMLAILVVTFTTGCASIVIMLLNYIMYVYITVGKLIIIITVDATKGSYSLS